MYKVTENYEATVNGGEKQLIPTKDALIIIGDYQMHLKKDVREMTYSNGVAHITLKDGTVIDLRPAVEETAEGEEIMKCKRVAPGYYEVHTPHGTYRVENTPSPKGSGYGSGPNWLIFGPSQTMADTSKTTKREALEYVRRASTPTLEDVELPSDEWDREQARREALKN